MKDNGNVGLILDILFMIATTIGGFMLNPIAGVIVLLYWAKKVWADWQESKQ